MPEVQVTGLSEAELLSALAYEVEPFSGIPSAQAEIEYARVDDADRSVRVFDVVVRRRAGRGTSVPGAAKKTAIALSVLACIAVAADFSLASFRLKSLKADVAVRAPLDARVKSVVAEGSRVRAEAESLRAGRREFERVQRRADVLRSAYSTLMEAIASSCGGKMVAKGFSSDAPFAAVMNASAVTVQACGEVMAELARVSEKTGWKVLPGQMGASGSTANFTCRFEFDAGKAEAAADGD